MTGYKWRPLQRAEAIPPSKEHIDAVMDAYACDAEEARRLLEDNHREFKSEYWKNDLYQVLKNDMGGYMVQLNIRRIDGAPCIRDWRHFQAIKNQLVGEECEGIELYPAESRKQDTCNKYHIWCVTDPTFRFPVGFTERQVVNHEVRGPPGFRQRGGAT